MSERNGYGLNPPGIPGWPVLLGNGSESISRAHGRINRENGTVEHTVDVRPHRGWFQNRGSKPRRERGDGSRLIATALLLLGLLAVGLFAVSYAAQYRYVLAQRSQVDASLIEAGGLDLIMAVLSLLALGLSRAGKRSSVERWGVVFMAAISASMNYAAANGGDWRSVLAWTMPPLALAFVVDRCVSVIRRHVLAMEDTGSPFLAAARAVGKVALFIGIALLYTLRLFLAPVETPKGMRRWVLNATPLPEAEPVKVTVIRPIEPREIKPRQRKAIEGGGRDGSKATKLIKLVIERYGSLAQFPLDRVSPVCRELAPLVGMDPGWARTKLRKAVLDAQADQDHAENESEGRS